MLTEYTCVKVIAATIARQAPISTPMIRLRLRNLCDEGGVVDELPSLPAGTPAILAPATTLRDGWLPPMLLGFEEKALDFVDC
jgi:hypothetical protein